MDQIWPNRNGTKRKRIFEIAKHCSWQKPAPKSSHPPPASFAHRTASSWPSPRNSSSLEPKNAAPLGQRKPNCNHLNLGVGTCRDPCIPGTPHEHLKRQRNIVELWHVCSSFALESLEWLEWMFTQRCRAYPSFHWGHGEANDPQWHESQRAHSRHVDSMAPGFYVKAAILAPEPIWAIVDLATAVSREINGSICMANTYVWYSNWAQPMSDAMPIKW